MSFKKVAVIGLGLIGGSLTAAFRRRRVADYIIGVDDEAVIEKARAEGLIDAGFTQNKIEYAVSDADLIILATPINRILKLLTLLPGFVKPGALVTDVGSTKEIIVKTAKDSFSRDSFFLGGHPMAGSEKSGLAHADPFLFENVTYVLTQSAEIPNNLVKKYVRLIEAIGARVLFLDAKTHDEIAAAVSHLPQILAVTLMNYTAKLNTANPDYLKLAAGGFRDMTRVAASPFEIWRDILKTNSRNIQQATEQLIVELNRIKEQLSAQKLGPDFKQAAQSHCAIPRDSRGFLSSYFDIWIAMEDKPGMIAATSTLLAQHKINIKDIELLKIREGDAGTIRLAFESETDREAALSFLSQANFKAGKRG